jgi:hypothetical protein
MADEINGRQGIDKYVNEFCGEGALLRRDYVGHGFLSSVSFEWDQWPKRTVFNLYGTNRVEGKIWKRGMTRALQEKYGIVIEPKAGQ